MKDASLPVLVLVMLLLVLVMIVMVMAREVGDEQKRNERKARFK